MKFKKQFSVFPSSFKIIKNEFYSYDPSLMFEEDLSLEYLSEDLLQIHLDDKNTTIDLGWYGNLGTNNGAFKIYVIKNQDWENPLKIETSKSLKEISEKLRSIIDSIIE